MAQELTLLMIKTSGNKAALAPRMESFPMTVTCDQTRTMLAHLDATFPQARAHEHSPEDGAMLSAEDAGAMIDIWAARAPDGASNFEAYLADAKALAAEGYALIVTLN